jgi:hypothetical protein
MERASWLKSAGFFLRERFGMPTVLQATDTLATEGETNV